MELPIISILRAAATDERVSLDMFDEARIRWVIETGLGPLLHHLTKDNSGTELSPFKPLLVSADLTARVLSQERLDALDEIIDACSKYGIRITLLKGISICEQYYPESHLRLMRDIDVLVDESVYQTIESALLGRGYVKRSNQSADFYETHHHGVPLYHPQRQIWVEIHKNLVRPGSALAQDRIFDRKTVASQCRPSMIRGHEVDRLSNELQIVYIATHGAKELQRIGGIIPMLDLIYLLKRTKGDVDWGEILHWLRDSRAGTYVFVLLTWLDRYGLIPEDSAAPGKLSAMQPKFGRVNLVLAHRLINEYIVKGRQYGKVLTDHNLAIVWETLCSPGPASRNLLLLPWNIIFPPNNPLRFSPNFQLERIKSTLGLKS